MERLLRTLCWWQTSAAHRAVVAAGRDCHCQARDIFIIIIINIFIREAALHRGKVFLWGWWTGVSERSTNGVNLLALTLRSSQAATLQG